MNYPSVAVTFSVIGIAITTTNLAGGMNSFHTAVAFVAELVVAGLVFWKLSDNDM